MPASHVISLRGTPSGARQWAGLTLYGGFRTVVANGRDAPTLASAGFPAASPLTCSSPLPWQPSAEAATRARQGGSLSAARPNFSDFVIPHPTTLLSAPLRSLHAIHPSSQLRTTHHTDPRQHITALSATQSNPRFLPLRWTHPGPSCVCIVFTAHSDPLRAYLTPCLAPCPVMPPI